MDDDRTISMGLFNTAEAYRLLAEYLEQAQAHLKKQTGFAAKPVQFLYSHAIELYLKSLLRTKHSLDVVEKFRHNIGRLVSEAETFGLVVTGEDRDLFAVLVDTDVLIEMRYIQTGSKTLEPIELKKLNRTCNSVRNSVGDLLRKADVPVRL